MASVTISCGREGETVTYLEIECETVGRYLGVHKPHKLGLDPNPPGWNVTHRPTGLAMISKIQRKRDAMRAAERIRAKARELRIDLRLKSMAEIEKQAEWKNFGAFVKELRNQLARL